MAWTTPKRRSASSPTSSSRSSSTRAACVPICSTSSGARRRRCRRRRTYAFEEETLYETHRGLIRWIRKLLNPLLKLLFNPNPLIQALHIQSELNTRNAKREELDTLYYEVMHNLVIELTRTSIEVKNLKMRVESMSSRLDFDERRARALEGVVMYRPGAAAPLQPPAGAEARPWRERRRRPSERRTRRRRRRPRRRPGERGEGAAGGPGRRKPRPSSGRDEAPQSDASDRGGSRPTDTSSDS